MEDYACGPGTFCMEDSYYQKSCMCKSGHFLKDPDNPALAETEGCISKCMTDLNLLQVILKKSFSMHYYPVAALGSYDRERKYSY